MGMNLLRICTVVVALAVVGCGGDKAIPVQPPAAQPPAAAAKALLQEAAQTGTLGSGAMQLREALEKLKATDAAKGAALLSDLTSLESTADPNAVKAKAMAMADKL